MKDILVDIQSIFRDYFDEGNLIISSETSMDNFEEWDSLAQMNLIVIMEKHFNIKFKINEISEIRTVGAFIEVIKSRL